MERSMVEVILADHHIRTFRKAISAMKNVNSFLILQTTGENTIRLCTTDHFASGSMDVCIPVSKHSVRTCITLDSQVMYELAKTIKHCKSAIKISICDEDVACFARVDKNVPIAAVSNCVHSFQVPEYFVGVDYTTCEFDSLDLLNLLTALNVGSPITRVRFAACGLLLFENHHNKGTTIIDKHLNGFETPCEHDEDNIDEGCTEWTLNQVYNIKFVKTLVNPLVNSSSKTCFLLLPVSSHDPLVVKFLLAHDIYQYYSIYPLTKQTTHITQQNHPQCSLQVLGSSPMITT